MRRLFVLLAGVGLMSAAPGCYHIAGKCDCAPPVAAVLHVRPVSAGIRHASAAADPAGGVDHDSSRSGSAGFVSRTDRAADEGADRAAAGTVTVSGEW